MIAGLLGEKLSHSYSPFIHREFADYQYKLFEKDKDSVISFIKNGEYDCLNVTIPYKKIALEVADIKSDVALRIGSANTLVKREGKIYATNTDYYGFKMLFDTIYVKKRKKALILGTGGAFLAVKAVLEDVGFEKIVPISRSGDDNYNNISKHKDADIIVNTTPVGMYPNNMQTPIEDLSSFTSLEAVYDIVYNPKHTKLLMDAQSLGIKCAGGLLMLVGQAAVSSFEFTGKRISDDDISKVYRLLDTSMQNIVLVGMPGSGKSTIGQIVAKKLARKFYDSDIEFQNTFSISPKDCIITKGEAYFRDRETEVLKGLSKCSGCVISTGGGAVERVENYPLLHQNSIIVYIKRGLESLDRSSRPLSGDLDALFKRRESLYSQFCDFYVENDSSADCCADKIIKLIQEGTL